MRFGILITALSLGLVGVPSYSQALPSNDYQVDAPLASHYEASEELATTLPESSLLPVPFTAEPPVSGSATDQVIFDLNVSEDSGSDLSKADSVPGSLILDDATIATLDLHVPTVRNAKINRHVEFFSYHIRDRFEQWLSRLERYRPTVQNIFSEFKLPLDLIFLSLVESGFNTNAVSRSKAVGPWQFMSQTAKNYGLRVDSWVDERRDPVKSTIAAAQYLRDLYHMFGSWPLAMAAYNAGEGKVGRSLARVQDGDFWLLTDKKLLKAETREYVPRFAAALQIAKDPTKFGFNIQPQPPVEYEEVAITHQVHLKAVAKAAGVSFEEIKTLNPELRRDMTPPDPLYILKVPVGKTTPMMANLATYQALYPAVYHEPKKSLFRGHAKAKLPVERLTKSRKTKGHKSQVLAKVTP